MLRPIFYSCLLAIAAGNPSIELELSFKTTLDEYPMAYSSASFTISDDIIYVVNGANVGNAILKFDLTGKYLGEYPGWFNFPHDILIGGDKQAVVSALGAMGDDGQLRFGFVVYDSEGHFLHGLHQNQSGVRRPFGMTKLGEGDWFLAADWDGNLTYLMDIDWTNGSVREKQELISVPWPDSLDISSDKIVVISYVCCQLEDFIKMTIYDLSGNLMKEVTHLPSGERILDPKDVAIDKMGNILLSDSSLGTVVMSGDGSQVLATLPLPSPVPHKMIFYQEKLYTLTTREVDQDSVDSFMNVYKYSL